MSKKICTIFAVVLAFTASLATPRPANAFFFMIIPLPNLAKPTALQKIIDALEKSKQNKAVAYVSENKIISTKYWTWSDVSGQMSQQEANETALKRCNDALARLKETKVGGQPVYDFGQNECKLYPFRTRDDKNINLTPPYTSKPRPAEVAQPSDAATDVKKLVAVAIREGRCGDAKDLALRINDLDLAEQALRLCMPKKVEDAGMARAKAAEDPTLSGDPELIKALQGDADAQLAIGLRYYSGQGISIDYAKALEWFLKSAELGEAIAMYNVGVMYTKGQALPKNEEAATTWFTRSAEKGYAKAQSVSGQRLRSGTGIPKDDAKAFGWFLKAAEQGDAGGQTNLGAAYFNGVGVPADKVSALRWFQKASEQGYAEGQYFLGLMYENGWGAPQDKQVSKLWFSKAAAQGNTNAIKQLGQPTSSLTTCADGTQTDISGTWACAGKGGIKQLTGTKR